MPLISQCPNWYNYSMFQQETQLSLINRATHLRKCNDVADLTSVIKIRLEKIDSSHPAFQRHSRSYELTRIDPPSMISYYVFYSNFVPKTHHFWDIWIQKCRDLENRVRVDQGHWKCHSYNREHATSRWCSIVTMDLSSVVSKIINAKKCCDLEIPVQGHSRTSKMLPFDRLGMVSY